MSVEDVRAYEKKQQEETNIKVSSGLQPLQKTDSTDSGDEFTLASEDLSEPGANALLDTEID